MCYQNYKLKDQLITLLLVVVCSTGCKKNDSNIPSGRIDNVLIDGGTSAGFQRIIGGIKLDNLCSVKQTKDGGYIFCGFTENEGASERDVLLLRTNNKGEKIWVKKLSDKYTDQGWHIEITSDNGYIIAATSTISAANTGDNRYGGQLIKTDSNGNQQWKKTYGAEGYNQLSTVRQTTDGGFIASSSEYGNHISYLLKTDELGNESWKKALGSFVEVSFVDKTHDGGFILCGSIQLNIAAPRNGYVIRTNSTGDTLWTKTFVNPYENKIAAIKETADGNFILCGYNANSNDIFGFARLINSTGEQLWNSDFSNLNIDVLDYINITNDNQFIAVGRQSFGSTTKAYLQKIDINGKSLWVKSFNPGTYNLFSEVQQTTDNGFILAGYSISYGNVNAYIVKTGPDGN